MTFDIWELGNDVNTLIGFSLGQPSEPRQGDRPLCGTDHILGEDDHDHG